MKVKLQVATSQQWTTQDGKRMVTIEGLLFGIGLCKIHIPEERVPDSLEGKNCVAEFSIGINKNFKPYLKVVSVNAE